MEVNPVAVQILRQAVAKLRRAKRLSKSGVATERREACALVDEATSDVDEVVRHMEKGKL